MINDVIHIEGLVFQRLWIVPISGVEPLQPCDLICCSTVRKGGGNFNDVPGGSNGFQSTDHAIRIDIHAVGIASYSSQNGNAHNPPLGV